MANKVIPHIHIIGQGVIGSLLATSALLQQYSAHQYVRTIPVEQQYTPSITVQWLSGQTVSLPQPHSLSALLHSNKQLSGLIIIPVKAYQMAQVLTQLQGKLAPDATLLLLHNGMGSIEVALRLFPNHAIIAGTTTLAGFREGNVIKHTAWGHVQLGIISNNSAALAHQPIPEHIELINHLLPEPTWHTDILTPLFTKLAINCVINPLTAIYNVQNGELAAPHFLGLIKEIVNEVVAVAYTKGVLLDNGVLVEQVLTVIADTRTNYSSMHQDVRHGRKSEIEQINGYVATLGADQGIDVSHNKSLLQQILAIEKAAN
jgi:2-dehydropantoate 2-reductase